MAVIFECLGKMEFYSESFIEAVGQVLNADCVVLGVVPYSREVQTFRGVRILFRLLPLMLFPFRRIPPRREDAPS